HDGLTVGDLQYGLIAAAAFLELHAAGDFDPFSLLDPAGGFLGDHGHVERNGVRGAAADAEAHQAENAIARWTRRELTFDFHALAFPVVAILLGDRRLFQRVE